MKKLTLLFTLLFSVSLIVSCSPEAIDEQENYEAIETELNGAEPNAAKVSSDD